MSKEMVLSVSFDSNQNQRVLVPYSSLTSIIVSRLRKMDLASVIHHLKDERTRSAQNLQSPFFLGRQREGRREISKRKT